MITEEDIERLHQDCENNEMTQAFLKWWDEDFEWRFSARTGGAYKAHALRCFKAGWEARQH